MNRQKRQVYEFDNFRLDAGERRLFRGGEPVVLPSKALDLLLLLIENNGRLVEKQELYQRVWADQIVEESNLTVQMSAIRKALGEPKQNPRYIETVPGYGYRFVANVASTGDDPEVAIETESVANIVIEKEETSDAGIRGGGETEDSDAPWRALNYRSGASPTAAGLDLGGSGALSGAAVSASPAAGAKSFWQRRPTRFMFAGLILALIVAAAGFWYYQLRFPNGPAAASRPASGVSQQRFTAHGGLPFRVAISRDGKSLVYFQRINGKESLWLGQIETNRSVPLNQQEGLTFEDLVFTPDGSGIYFKVSGANRPQAMLARMPVLGGVITELIPSVRGPVTFSPDGKLMAFLSREDKAGETSIIIADAADGRNQHTLISRKRPESFSSDGLSWSSDSKNIAFSSYSASGREQIMLVGVADGSVRRIGSRDWSEVDRVVWLPDGSGLLVLAGANIGGRRRQIWLVSYPGGEPRLITNDLNIFVQSDLSVSADGKLAILQGHVNAEIWIAPRGDAKQARRVLRGVAPRYEGVDGLAWTPDGRLLYSAYVGDNRVIWSIDRDGSDPRQLTSNKPGVSDSNICTTADGRTVVFQSNRSGSIDIWRVNSDGSNVKQLTTGGNNSQPSLLPDGRWIVYAAGRAGKTTLARIPIDGGEPTEITEIPASMYQVSPDGRSIACMAESPWRLLIIPFAGGAPVKSWRVPETALRGARMRWTPDGKAILYQNYPQGLVRQSLDEEGPRLVKGFEGLHLRNFAWSFDGKEMAYVTGLATQEIILIENFK